MRRMGSHMVFGRPSDQLFESIGSPTNFFLRPSVTEKGGAFVAATICLAHAVQRAHRLAADTPLGGRLALPLSSRTLCPSSAFPEVLHLRAPPAVQLSRLSTIGRRHHLYTPRSPKRQGPCNQPSLGPCKSLAFRPSAWADRSTFTRPAGASPVPSPDLTSGPPGTLSLAHASPRLGQVGHSRRPAT